MRPKQKAYLETTILSFAAGRLSGNLITAAKQQFTQAWIESFLKEYDCYVSDAVVTECLRGDAEAAQRRQAFLRRIRILDVDDAALTLAEFLVKSQSMPAKAGMDALHVATSAVNGMDYLVTWNCTHINNAAMRPKIEAACRTGGYRCPVICTPMELEVTP
jgi:hypothetical protein